MKYHWPKLCIALGSFFALIALAQGQSTGTLSMIVPYPAGGTSDVFARAVSPSLGQRLDQTVIVENVSGASGSIAAAKVLAVRGNGAALLMGSPTDAILAPLLIKGLKYQGRDFELLGLISKAPLTLYVRGNLPINNVDELLAYARKPGAAPLSYGSTGLGSTYHLAGDAFARMTQLEMTHVPYRGGSPLLQDLMGGMVDMAFLPADGNNAKLASGGKFKAIAVAAPARTPIFPFVPTFSESRAVPQFSVPEMWAGVLVPRSTRQPLLEKMHKAMAEALSAPDVHRALEVAAGVSLPPPLSVSELEAFYEGQIKSLTAAAANSKVEAN